MARRVLTVRPAPEIEADPELKARLDKALEEYNARLASSLADKLASTRSRLSEEDRGRVEALANSFLALDPAQQKATLQTLGELTRGR